MDEGVERGTVEQDVVFVSEECRTMRSCLIGVREVCHHSNRMEVLVASEGTTLGP